MIGGVTVGLLCDRNYFRTISDLELQGDLDVSKTSTVMQIILTRHSQAGLSSWMPGHQIQ